MPRPILYINDITPPCRAVLIVSEVLGIQFDIRQVKMVDGEDVAMELWRINRHLIIPAMNDNGHHVWSSRAIMSYLCDVYGKNNLVYPRDHLHRTTVDHQLYFNDEKLFFNAREITNSLINKTHKTVIPSTIRLLDHVYDFLDRILGMQKWMIPGEYYTLADISGAVIVSSLNAFRSLAPHQNILRWIKGCEDEIPGYKKFNDPGNKKFHDVFQGWLSQL